MVHSVDCKIIATHPILFDIIKTSIKWGIYQKTNQYNDILFLRKNVTHILSSKDAIILKTTRIISSVNEIIATANNGLTLTPNDTIDSSEISNISSAIGMIILCGNEGIILNDNNKIIQTLMQVFEMLLVKLLQTLKMELFLQQTCNYFKYQLYNYFKR